MALILNIISNGLGHPESRRRQVYKIPGTKTWMVGSETYQHVLNFFIQGFATSVTIVKPKRFKQDNDCLTYRRILGLANKVIYNNLDELT
jgi:hypothetical protein